MNKSKVSLQYKVGDPVWARMDGYPWWPARVVTRNDVIVDSRDEEPLIDENSHLVEFFNDNKRFAVITKRFLRPFNEDHLQINKTYSGNYFGALNEAIREAKDYATERGLGWGSKRGGNRKKKETLADDLDEKSIKNEEGGEPAEVEEEATVGEEGTKTKRKKESQKTEKPKNRVKEKKEHGDDSVRKKRKRRAEETQGDENDVLIVEKKKFVKKGGESAAVPDLLDSSVPRKSKRRKSEPLEEEEGKDKGEKKATKVMVQANGNHTRKQKYDRREHAAKAEKEEVVPALKRREGIKGDDKRRGAENEKRTPESKEAVSRRKELERGAERHDEASEQRDTKLMSERKENERKKEVKPEVKSEPVDNFGAMAKSADDRIFRNGEMYRKLSREQLVELVKAYEKQNRSLRLQVWQLRLQSVDRSKIVTTMEEFIPKCAPGFNSVHKMITSCEQEQDEKRATEATEAGKEKRMMERKKQKERMEEQVCEQLELLRHVYFEPSIMRKTPRILLRAMKLATKILPHSLKIGRVMRELIVQWVDMVAIENMSSEESGKGAENVGESRDWTEEKMDVDEKEGSEELEDLDKMDVEQAGRTDRSDDRMKESCEEGISNSRKEEVGKGMERRNEIEREEKNEGSGDGMDAVKQKENEETEGGKDKMELKKEDEVDRDKEKGRTGRRESKEEKRMKQEEDKDKSPSKSEQRVVDFTRERCTVTFNCMLKPLIGRRIEGTEMTELKVEELAEDLERAVEPRRDDDMKRYFDVSKKVLKLLSRSNEARDAALQVALRRNAKEFVQKCVDGAFLKDVITE